MKTLNHKKIARVEKTPIEIPKAIFIEKVKLSLNET